MYRQSFCSGLSMVMAANVGHIWELARLSCPRRHIPGRAKTRGGGMYGRPRDANFVLPTHSLRREVVGEGALRGRSPRTREAACGRPPKGEERVERIEERENFDGLVGRREMNMALSLKHFY